MKNKVFYEDLQHIHNEINKNKFKNTTILITGCAGFLGFYILNYFLKYFEELEIKKIIGLDTFILSKPKWLDELIDIHKDKLEVYKFDISKDKIDQIKYSENVNYVIHMASIASPSFYRKYPIVTLDANVWGLRQLLDFYKTKLNFKSFLFFSSSEIYGDPDVNNIPTSEEYRGNVSSIGPRACYDESKRFGETICYLYSISYSMPISIVRPFNNYGPGMRINDKRLPADFASQILNKKDIKILSDGKPTRTFCYVSDAIIGYLLALTNFKFDFFNIGIDKPEISVFEFAKIFVENAKLIFGYSPNVLFEKSKDLNYLIDNPYRRCPNISKARNLLGYNPQIDPYEGVKRYLLFLKGTL